MILQKKVLAFIFLSFAITAKAQVTNPFDEASLTRGLQQVGSVGSNMTNLNRPSKCPAASPANPDAVVGCSATAEDYSKSVIGKIDFAPDKIDPRLNSIVSEDFRKDAKGKKVSCIIIFNMTNDDKQMLGVKGSAADTGDDAGHTHGLGLSLNCTTEDGISKTFSYDAQLYSQPEFQNGQSVVQPDGRIKQKIISETIFAFLQDNINQGKLTYWKRGVGFINVTDQQKLGPLSPANQQQWFHGMVNKIGGEGSAPVYQNEQGSMNKWAPFVSMSVGLQQHAQLGNRCFVSVAGDTGFRLSPMKDASYWNANANAKISYRVTSGSALYVKGSYDMTNRPGSSVVQQSSAAAGFQLLKSGTFIELGSMKQQGNRKDVLDIPNMYTGKNDPMIFLRIGVGIK